MVDRNQTKKKLQAAAKKRRRAPKGAAHAGEFVSSGTQKLHNIFMRTAGSVKGPHRVESDETRKMRRERDRAKDERLAAEKEAEWAKRHAEDEIKKARGDADPYQQESSAVGAGEAAPNPNNPADRPEMHAIMIANDLINQGQDPDVAFRTARSEAHVETGRPPDMKKVRKYVQGDMKTVQTMPTIDTTGRGVGQRNIDDQTGDWWTTAQSPDTKRSKSGVKPDSSRRKRGKPSEQKAMMSPAERDWLDEQTQTEGSPYYQSTGREGVEKNKANLRIYAALREEGHSPEEAHKEVINPQRVQGQGRVSRPARPQSEAQQEASKRVQETTKPKSTGVKTKYGKSGGAHEDFAASVRVPGVDIEQIKKDFPDWTDQQLVEYERQHKQDVYDWLEKNERWAHEQRVANVLGKPDTGENKDRVVFFTTNAGSPAASVPANSLVGQYVIKKRKKMVVDERNATRSDVKGEFPRAVRDQHLIEVSTGLSLGAQGRYGAFHTTGWKAGKKRSKGYGKQVPVGTQILRDKNNQPVYDKNGNLRYTEGYTRPFTLTTDRDVGLRIFIG